MDVTADGEHTRQGAFRVFFKPCTSTLGKICLTLVVDLKIVPAKQSVTHQAGEGDRPGTIFV